jgi:hypothetical protein
MNTPLAEAAQFIRKLFNQAPPPKAEQRWRRRADQYIANWIEWKRRDPEGLGWARVSLLGRIIDGLHSAGLPIEAQEAETERQARFVEQTLAGLWAFGAAEWASAFQLYHMSDGLPVSEQSRLLNMPERKYNEARRLAYNFLRWEVFKHEGKGSPLPSELFPDQPEIKG